MGAGAHNDRGLERYSGEPVFFVDRSLGSKFVPAALRGAGEQVEIHDDHFPMDAPDYLWLRKAGAEGWIALSAAKRIRYRPLEKLAVQDAGVPLFVLVSAVGGEETASAFVAAANKMKRLVADRGGGPFIAKVYRDGRVSLWEDFGGAG